MASDLTLNESDHDQLVSGRSPWGGTSIRPPYKSLSDSFHIDVAVIGGGITGALAAEVLTARGLSVCIIDREQPGLGSTAASTAMLQWEIDRQLSELEEFYGFERASATYRRSVIAVHGLADLITTHGIACQFQPRSSLYITSGPTGAHELAYEYDLRRRAGLQGRLLEHPDLMAEFDIDRDGAILSPGSAEVDPLLLTWGLLDIGIKRGARLVNASAVRLHAGGAHVTIETDGPYEIEADNVVLATGYSMPGIDMPKLHRTLSSYAIATAPQAPETLWRDGLLLWEDTHPYLYARTTADHRIVAGGEDDETIDPQERDSKLPAKIAAIREKLRLIWPEADMRVDYAWCGTFGETVDGLPLIGPVPGVPRVYAAYGYGGNGITFSYMAAQMIGAMISGVRRDWFDDFALDRDGPPSKFTWEAEERIVTPPPLDVTQDGDIESVVPSSPVSSTS
ncbi:FAD-dependent oxidoreductase [Rhizobium sp. BK251]|uniref:NAD(P)/FAD-dependent oxidoreductase n=1 Tax=Rhizobium sp. BK251 TaxID=2512125 RepID=UPI00104DFBF8|nr:FAD-dependent oxidoreductase [Rhizobium sp. BK251]TCL76099.1 glycine/D-amino acid oxidase-like deaminating enzyme [Rhizobium sp. BK251]